MRLEAAIHDQLKDFGHLGHTFRSLLTQHPQSIHGLDQTDI